MQYIVAYLVSNLIITYAIMKFMGVFFIKVKYSYVMTLLSYLFYFVVSSLVFLFINIPLLTVTINVICYFLIASNYESPIIKRFVAVFSTLVFFILAESISFLVFGIEHESVLIGIDTAIFDVLGTGVIALTLALTLQRFKVIKFQKAAPFFHWFVFIVIPILSVVNLLLVLIIENPSFSVATIFVAITFALNYFVAFLHDIIAKSHQEKLVSIVNSKEKEFYYSQCQIMQNSSESLKSFRHDIVVHLVALRELASENDDFKVISYLNKLLGQLERSELHCETGNLAFDSVVNYKFNSLNEKEIKIDMNLFIPPKLNIELIDLVVIISNLLDNAVEAISKLDEKWISFKANYRNGTLIIEIKNPYDGKIIIRDENKPIIASSKQSDDHGFGLKNIKNAVDKYNGELVISTDNNTFTVTILLFNNQKQDMEL